ncbi:hypothetical protein BC829DRAFT_446991 [Chytridium lagenaria]|nr:hypothetical protein BC829DRAFT_446991 [Chytridium lagenaria]
MGNARAQSTTLTVPTTSAQATSTFTSTSMTSQPSSTTIPPIATEDPCGLLIGKPFSLLPEVYACYNVFEASYDFKKDHVATLKQFLDIYPFTDLYINTPPSLLQLNKNVNLVAELDQLVNDPTVTTQHEFFSRITLLISSSTLDFAAIYPSSSATPIIQIIDTLNIDDIPWSNYLPDFDPSIYVNHTINPSTASMPAILLHLFPRSRRPPNPNLRHHTPNGSPDITLTIPWVASTFYGFDYTDSDSYYTNNCAFPVTPTDDTASLRQQRHSRSPLLPNSHRPITPADLLPSVPIAASLANTLTLGPLGSTLRVVSLEVVPKWVATIVGGLQSLEKRGAKRLIIDVSGNGGGYFCISTAIAEYLFPKTGMIVDQIRFTPSTRALLNIDFYGFQGGDAVPINNDTTIFTSSYTQDRGGGPQSLSGLFRFCQSGQETDFSAPCSPLQNGWNPKMLQLSVTVDVGVLVLGGVVAGFMDVAGIPEDVRGNLTVEERRVVPGNFSSVIYGQIPFTQGYSMEGWKEGQDFEPCRSECI